jgi:hypothetical protein
MPVLKELPEGLVKACLLHAAESRTAPSGPEHGKCRKQSYALCCGASRCW